MTTFPALVEAQEKLKAGQKSLAEVFTEAGPELDMAKVKCIDGDSKAKTEWIRAKDAELNDLGDEVTRLKAVAGAAERHKNRAELGDDEDGQGGAERGDGSGRKTRRKSWVEHFLCSDAYTKRGRGSGPEAHLDIEVKSLFDSGSWTPEITRGPRIEDALTPPIQLLDLIPTTTTGQPVVRFQRETIYENNAGAIAEGGIYPESALGLDEEDSPVRKVGTWLPITDEELEDEPRARAYILNRLPMMVRQRLDAMAMSGNGVNPTLQGLLNTPFTQIQHKGGDPVPDAMYKLMTKIEVNGLAFPDATLWNPTDWQGVRLMRTTDGIYIWGSPSEAGPDRIWGLPAIKNFGLPQGTAAAGAFGMFSELAYRRGIDIQISNSHGGFFIEGKQAVRCDVRAALIFYRPQAFGTVDGL